MQRVVTSLYFESPYRIVDTLGMIAAAKPEHRIVVARELTKIEGIPTRSGTASAFTLPNQDTQRRNHPGHRTS